MERPLDNEQRLLEVWREIGRSQHLSDLLGKILGLMASTLPAAGLRLEQIERPRRALTTAADTRAASQERRGAFRERHTACTPAEFERLLKWCERGETVGLRAGEAWPPALAPIAGPFSFEPALVGPLIREGGGPGGLAVLTASAGREFSADDEALFRRLLEPLAAALGNDARVREMASLRAAAEADKQSLLTRLGREQVADELVGGEDGLKAVMDRVALVARSDSSVLLLGETGSGKEVVARTVHDRSLRARGPFIRVNCGAIPPELIDSELFGHEKGSFTGASAQRKGWFERADGGTLFLDEVGELPAAAQVRLLRVLQDGSLHRVGGESPLQVDVRVVAATHRDLAGMVAAGGFRQDLWYRIAVFPIAIPPLRERPRDIPALARHFARRAAIRLGLPPQLPSDEDIALLRAYPWPGNVRELGSVIERAAILGNGEGLQVAVALGAGAPGQPPAAPAAAVASAGRSDFPTLDEAMVAHIQAALDRTRGRIEGPTGAAKLLGINPHTLRSRMRKLGVDASGFRR